MEERVETTAPVAGDEVAGHRYGIIELMGFRRFGARIEVRRILGVDAIVAHSLSDPPFETAITNPSALFALTYCHEAVARAACQRAGAYVPPEMPRALPPGPTLRMCAGCEENFRPEDIVGNDGPGAPLCRGCYETREQAPHLLDCSGCGVTHPANEIDALGLCGDCGSEAGEGSPIGTVSYSLSAPTGSVIDLRAIANDVAQAELEGRAPEVPAGVEVKRDGKPINPVLREGLAPDLEESVGSSDAPPDDFPNPEAWKFAAERLYISGCHEPLNLRVYLVGDEDDDAVPVAMDLQSEGEAGEARTMILATLARFTAEAFARAIALQRERIESAIRAAVDPAAFDVLDPSKSLEVSLSHVEAIEADDSRDVIVLKLVRAANELGLGGLRVSRVARLPTMDPRIRFALEYDDAAPEERLPDGFLPSRAQRELIAVLGDAWKPGQNLYRSAAEALLGARRASSPSLLDHPSDCDCIECMPF